MNVFAGEAWFANAWHFLRTLKIGCIIALHAVVVQVVTSGVVALVHYGSFLIVVFLIIVLQER